MLVVSSLTGPLGLLALGTGYLIYTYLIDPWLVESSPPGWQTVNFKKDRRKDLTGLAPYTSSEGQENARKTWHHYLEHRYKCLTFPDYAYGDSDEVFLDPEDTNKDMFMSCPMIDCAMRLTCRAFKPKTCN